VVASIYFFRVQIAELIWHISKIGWGSGVIEFTTMVRAIGKEVGHTGETAGRGQPLEAGDIPYSSWEAFVKVYDWLDLTKPQQHANVWAAKHNIPNAYDVGAGNFRAFLAEEGLPGGKIGAVSEADTFIPGRRV
jgi:hypothetical protein